MCYTPHLLGIVNDDIKQCSFDKALKDSGLSLMATFLLLEPDVKHKVAANNAYAVIDYLRLVNLGLIALFTNCMLTSVKGKN